MTTNAKRDVKLAIYITAETDFEDLAHSSYTRITIHGNHDMANLRQYVNELAQGKGYSVVFER